MRKIRLFTALAILFVLGVNFASGQAGVSPTPGKPPKQSGEFEIKGVAVDAFVPTPTGGRIKFKHEGKIQTADLTQARVYTMRSGRKTAVPKPQWKAVLSKGARTDLRVRLGDTSILIAVIAIVKG